MLLCELFQVMLFVFLLYRPGYTKQVPGEGMPISSDPTKKGDLIIEFNIEFPTSLTPEKKQLVQKALH